MAVGANVTENPFLGKLLTLQQDGSAAISTPGNWAEKPLLQVRTDLDDVIEDLVEGIANGTNDHAIARWHFFVGSPGNGKSAGTGELARKLVDRGFSVRDIDGNELSDIPPVAIPYKLEVFESGQRHACAYVAQDASVVPDPYSDKANPATALVELLQEAAERGVSLIVCTNRGVLERAFAAHYLDNVSNKTVWFAALRSAVQGDKEFERKFDGSKRQVFEAVSFKHTSLDRRSLLVGRNSFDELVKKATDAGNWVACDLCSVKKVCPFFQNRQWLAEQTTRSSFVGLVRHAEILSGQIVVFREALALISLILAGCPHDYPEGSPCKWVHGKAREGKYFSLLSRRIYMTLFSAYAPFGLEPFARDRHDQQQTLLELAGLATGDQAGECRRALAEVAEPEPSISSDVGVSRLVGSDGLFRLIDCMADVQQGSFYERWDDSARSPFEQPPGLFSDLEARAFGIWITLQDAAEARSGVAGGSFFWLSRWITAFTHRAGALLSENFTYAEEIGSLVKILALEDPPDDDGFALVEQIESDLWGMLHSKGDGAQITPIVRLKGEWVNAKLKPRIDLPKATDEKSIVLNLSFNKNTQVPLSALAFVWLKRRSARAMADASFPHHFLESAEDALVKAASESGYFIENDDVELVVSLPPDGEKKISLKRARGRVIINGL